MASHNRLRDKVAIVTGASSGIGRAIALLFAHEGAHVVCADLSEQAANDGADSDEEVSELDTHLFIREGGGSSLFVHTDVRIARDMDGLVRRTVQEYGRLDIFVNNAGIFPEIDHPRPVWNMPEGAWDATMNVNAKGVFLGCKYASAQMVRQEPHANGDRGWIINTASVLGLVGQQNSSSYCASAGAIVNFTKAAALDCAPYRVHVNAICPGYTATPQTQNALDDPNVQRRLLGLHPFRGLGIPDDLARAALFLASEDASWISGACIPVDGGYLAQ